MLTAIWRSQILGLWRAPIDGVRQPSGADDTGAVLVTALVADQQPP